MKKYSVSFDLPDGVHSVKVKCYLADVGMVAVEKINKIPNVFGEDGGPVTEYDICAVEIDNT